MREAQGTDDRKCIKKSGGMIHERRRMCNLQGRIVGQACMRHTLAGVRGVLEEVKYPFVLDKVKIYCEA